MTKAHRTPFILFGILALGALLNAAAIFLLLAYGSRTTTELTQMITNTTASGVRNRLNRNVMHLEGLRSYWLRSETVTPEDFAVQAAEIRRFSPELTAVEWVDPANIVRYVHPLEGENLKAVGFDNNAYPNRLETIMTAKRTGSSLITPPVQLVQGYPGVIIYVPIFRGDEYLGAVVGVVKLDELFSTLKTLIDRDTYEVAIRAGDKLLPLHEAAIYTTKGERVIDAAGAVADDERGRVHAKPYSFFAPVEISSQDWEVNLRHHRDPVDTTVMIGALCALMMIVSFALLLVTYRKQRTLEEANEREREFVSLVSHQLRIPLTELSWMIDGVFETASAMTEEQSTTIQEIRAIVRNSVKLINDLLNVSRIERGVMEIKCDESVLAQVVDDVLKPMVRMANERRVKFAVTVPKKITVFADHVKAVEAIRNVIDNALKYGPRDSTIEIGVQETESYAILSIRDHGSGIPKDIRSKLFDKSSAFSKKGNDQQSAGLGLYLTKQFIELMGGDVSFTSTPEGTTFSISLPTYRGEGCGEDET